MAPSSTNRQLARKDHAFVVGIADYPTLGDNDSARNLEGPVNDAHAMTRWLVEEAGVPCENVICITSEGRGNCRILDGQFGERFNGDGGKPTRLDIETIINDPVDEALNTRGGPSRKGRRLWVYLAGHGFRSSSAVRDVCVLSADASREHALRNLCITQWMDYVALNNPFDEVVLWADCCSDILYGVAPYGPPEMKFKVRHKIAPRLFILGSTVDRKAYEAPDASGVTGGNFTRILLSALRGDSTRTQDGYISSEDLKNYFENRAIVGPGEQDSPNSDNTADVMVHDKMNIVHIGKNTAWPLYAIPTHWSRGTRCIVRDHSNNQIGDSLNIADGGKALVNLIPGHFKLVAADGDELLFETKLEYRIDKEQGN